MTAQDRKIHRGISNQAEGYRKERQTDRYRDIQRDAEA